MPTVNVFSIRGFLARVPGPIAALQILVAFSPTQMQQKKRNCVLSHAKLGTQTTVVTRQKLSSARIFNFFFLRSIGMTSLFKHRNLVLNPLNAELNPIRHLLALVGARHIVHVSRIRVKSLFYSCASLFLKSRSVPCLLKYLGC